MNFEEFREKLKKERAFDKYFYGMFAVAVIAFLLYAMLFKEYSYSDKINIIIGGTLIILFCIYAIRSAIRIDKFFILSNNLTKTENQNVANKLVFNLSNIKNETNYIIFVYRRKNIWKSPYKIYVFADDGYIAVNVNLNYNNGIIDFGASSRMQKKVIRLLEEHINI